MEESKTEESQATTKRTGLDLQQSWAQRWAREPLYQHLEHPTALARYTTG